MKLAYLTETGKRVRIPRKTADYGGPVVEAVLEMLHSKGIDAVEAAQNSISLYNDDKTLLNAIADIDSEIRFRFIKDEAKRQKAVELARSHGMAYGYFSRLLEHAATLQRDLANGGRRQVVDEPELREMLDKRVPTDNKAYRKWLDDLFDGIVEKRGIRNGRDPYTPSGNRRSFEATHNPVTLESVVKAMLSQNERGGQGFFGSSPIGAAAREYNTLDDIRGDRGRLQVMSEKEYFAQKEEYMARFGNIVADILAQDSAGSSFEMGMDARRDIIDAISKRHDAKGIYNYYCPLKHSTPLPNHLYIWHGRIF